MTRRVRTLPRILTPVEVDALTERRVFIAEGKGGHQRLIPVWTRFFAAVAAYLDVDPPAGAGTDRVFVVLKGPNRGQPLSVRAWIRCSPARSSEPA